MDKFVVTKRLRDEAPGETAGERWRPPKKFAVSKGTSRSETTETSNSFTGLPVDDEITESFKKAATKKSAGQIPPILIELLGDWSHQNIKGVIEKYEKGFHLEYRGRNRVKVQCYSVSGHQAVKDGLLKENVVFHTFSRKDQKLPKAVIRGLPSFLQDSIPSELASLGFPGITATQIKTLYETECPPLLIQLPSGTDMRKFKQIKYLLNCVVDIQKFRPSTKQGTQCFRCQEFGHASKNCNRPPRCVKCAAAHPTWECSKKDRVEAALCCNCKQDHPANYSRCPARLNYLERIQSRREKLRNLVPSTGKISNAPAATEPNLPTSSWAHVTARSRSQATVSEPIKLTQIEPNVAALAKPHNHARVAPTPGQEEPKQLLSGKTTTSQDFATAEMLEILSNIRTLKQEFCRCETFIDKVILILTYMGHYV